MVFAILDKQLNTRSEKRWKKKPAAIASSVLLACLGLPCAAQTCPDLQAYYPVAENQWFGVEQQLQVLMPDCLASAEYFALLGAAQLNTGFVSAALESLERALLLEPDNGSARIDYAQALHIAGQLFPALEINQGLLQRTDLPAGLVSMLQERQQVWESQTSNKGLVAEMALGYDNNLNGAPARSDFMLNLSGEQISVTLDPEYRPISGPYLNFRVAGFYQKRTPDNTHDWLFAVRNRVSEDSGSELLQFDWRYSLAVPLLGSQWELTAGTSHLLYGGSPLYSVTEGRVRYRISGDGCKPLYELAAQHQFYHGQNIMSGFESSASAGLECRLGDGRQLFGVETGVLSNIALKDDRPGGDRQGWKLRLVWLMQLQKGVVSSQFSYARLGDDEGYSGALANGASRTIHSRLFRLQYTRPLQPDLSFMVNVSHQGQGSNIAPFENRGTAMEVGLSLNF